ncbi:MAG TPA: STAS domain-containing protein [Streptosporangiaceae bacterium]|jgi:anti-sigma B factor antagonist|nr:STAS domain-containing protein [Streptosporangiaceae bacterium]
MVDEDLTTTVVRHLDYRVLALAGEIDMHTAPTLRDQIFALIAEDRRPLVVDLTDISFCDSAGVNVAAAARKHAVGQGVTLAIAGLHGRVEKIFRMTGMDRLIPIYATLPEAAFDLIKTSLSD